MANDVYSDPMSHFDTSAGSSYDMLGAGAAPVASMGMNYGRAVVSSTVGKYLPGMAALWHSMRYYFQVNNSYVLNKMKVILLPFRHKKWDRETTEESGGMRHNPAEQGGGASHAPPVHDVNAPDLYLPLMSFLTLVLLKGLLQGMRAGVTFTPEVLSDITSACLVTQILEVGLIKLGLHLLSSSSVPLLDLVAYTGYKYVGLVINTLIGLFLGSTFYYVALAYTGASAVFMMAQTLSHVVTAESHLSASSKRNYLLLGTSCLQFLLMWWLGGS